MSKKMLLDASHAEELRVAVVGDKTLEEFECETSTKKPIRSNIYLARVVRVEPSLQAAFVDFGRERHGFLAFNEIHPDYYRIPVEDQAKLLKSLSEESAGDEEDPEEVEDPKPRFKTKAMRAYKIQEVIKKRQVILVQVVKDERGGKGAALTTYLSLPGRYCVLMPNTPRGSGISRKISDAEDRKHLKELVEGLNVVEGAGLIVRTAGLGRTKLEIKRDYDYLMRLWEEIREKTLQSQAPSVIYEEGNLITKAIRDLYGKDIEEIWVEGEVGYKQAKNLMKIFMPSHAKKVQLYKDSHVPLFHRYGVEEKIDNIHHPVVQLPSGGYVVINPTEALVSIDVNSGRATRERHIEETALKTNLEAAAEIARQLRLRDLAGLIVIDFIDMDQGKHNTQVERAFRDVLKGDRARIQVGAISSFGLLEMSRQRLRASLAETISMPCTHCEGTGIVRSIESSALQVLRALEREGIEGKFSEIHVSLPTTVAFYLLNQKRHHLWSLEQKYKLKITVIRDDALMQPNFSLERLEGPEKELEGAPLSPVSEKDSNAPQNVEMDELPLALSTEETATDPGEATRAAQSSPRRGRRRRGDRRRGPLDPLPQDLQQEEGAPSEGVSFGLQSAPADAVPPVRGQEGMEGEDQGVKGELRQGGRRRPRKAPTLPGAPSSQGSEQGTRPPTFPRAFSAPLNGERRAPKTNLEEPLPLPRRLSTRLKVGPGAARHFGKTYAKLTKGTIKRPGEDSVPAVFEAAGGPLPKSSFQQLERKDTFVASVPQEPLQEQPFLKTGNPQESGTAPLQKAGEQVRLAAKPHRRRSKKPENERVTTEEKTAGGKGDERMAFPDAAPLHPEATHIQQARKKGWWQRLLDS